jgi:type IV secretion system protein VirB1
MLATIVLAQLLRDCAPNVDPRTMAAVVHVESGGNRLALHDNTSGRSYAPGDSATAAAWATELIGMGHNVDLGLSQINSDNLPKLGLRVSDAFDACTNLKAGATILGGDYASAVAHFGPGQIALRRALGAYNTGSLFAGQGYINQILVAAGLAPEYGDASASTASRPATAAATASSVVVYGTRPASLTAHRDPRTSVDVIQGGP